MRARHNEAAQAGQVCVLDLAVPPKRGRLLGGDLGGGRE